MSLIFLTMCALLCVFLEAARTAGARWYLQTALNSATESLFSEYHRLLWDRYNIFGAEMDSAQAEAHLAQFLEPYLEETNWYPCALAATTLASPKTLADEEGAYFEREIVALMKYAVWKNLDFDPNDADKTAAQIQSAAAAAGIAGEYRKQTKTVVELEGKLEDIQALLERENAWVAQGEQALARYDGKGFLNILAQLQRENGRMPALVESYGEIADRLAAELDEAEETIRREQEKLDDEALEQLPGWATQYASYVRENGAKRAQIRALGPLSERNDALIERLKAQAQAVMDEIDSYCEPEDEYDEETGELIYSGASDAPDEAELWGGVARTFAGWGRGDLGISRGKPDREKQGWLKTIQNLAGDGLLGIVIPAGAQVSKAKMPDGRVALGAKPASGGADAYGYGTGTYGAGGYGTGANGTGAYGGYGGSAANGAPAASGASSWGGGGADAHGYGTGTYGAGSYGTGANGTGAYGTGGYSTGYGLGYGTQTGAGEVDGVALLQAGVTAALVGEYCGGYFTDFLSAEKKPVQYELEYLVGGCDKDTDNLQATLLGILAVREGFNLIHLLSDSPKQAEARALAATLAGVTGMAVLLEVFYYFVLLIWALGEGVMDLRTLLAGGKVPLIKSAQDWKLSIEGLLSLGKSKNAPVETETNISGVGYVGYVKMLLLCMKPSDKYARMMDVMQMNIRRSQPQFVISECLCATGINATFDAKHLFFSLPFVERVVGGGETAYTISVSTYKKY
ncbi:MAG: DUF5702 domain-containing protein [Lachnospiraceae bacterium]|nr:DUF5702 domain-containing protein [Lachnospiraceae bacterium]